jgi:hypothetical protein
MQTVSTKNVKPIWLILSGIATIGIAYGIYYLLTKDGKFLPLKSNTTSKDSFCKYSGFPLRFGSCGKEVLVLQKYLNSKIKIPRVPLVLDGKFGNSTKESLLRIEKISTVTEAKYNQFKIQFNPFL